MSKMPKRIRNNAIFAFVIGMALLFVYHAIHNELFEELVRDIGIALIVAAILTLIFEWSTRESEKSKAFLENLSISFDKMIPDGLWEEVQLELFTRGFYRSNLVMEVELYTSAFELDGKIATLPPGICCIKTTMKYDVTGMLNRVFWCDHKVYLDNHMRNEGLNLPRFLSFKQIIDGKAILNLTPAELSRLSPNGCLTLDGTYAVKVLDGKKMALEVSRYELVNLPGLYTMVLPEMLIPTKNEDSNEIESSIIVVFKNYDEFKSVIDIKVETWFSSKNKQFVPKDNGMAWEFKGILLPGQGYSIVFQNKL